MNFLIIGDVVGRSGRNALKEKLSAIKIKNKIDFTIVNAENSAAGFGLTGKIYEEMISGELTQSPLVIMPLIDDIISYMKNNPNHNIIRPLNFLEEAPGRGFKIFQHSSGKSVLVSQVHTKLFINLPLNDPFEVIDRKLLSVMIDNKIDFSFLEVHGEATSEKNGIAQNYDGKFTAIYGTHVHIPTSDARVLKGGTCFKTDIGMTGDYDSIIGMKKENAIKRMRTGVNSHRLEPADGDATISGVIIRARSNGQNTIESIQIGGVLGTNLLS